MMNIRTIDPVNLRWLNGAVGTVAAQVATRHCVLVSELLSPRCKTAGALAARREFLGVLIRQFAFRQECDGALHFSPMEQGETLPPVGHSFLTKPMLVRLASLDKAERAQYLGRTKREILNEQADRIRAAQERLTAYRYACATDRTGQSVGSAMPRCASTA